MDTPRNSTDPIVSSPGRTAAGRLNSCSRHHRQQPGFARTSFFPLSPKVAS